MAKQWAQQHCQPKQNRNYRQQAQQSREGLGIWWRYGYSLIFHQENLTFFQEVLQNPTLWDEWKERSGEWCAAKGQVCSSCCPSQHVPVLIFRAYWCIASLPPCSKYSHKRVRHTAWLPLLVSSENIFPNAAIAVALLVLLLGISVVSVWRCLTVVWCVRNDVVETNVGGISHSAFLLWMLVCLLLMLILGGASSLAGQMRAQPDLNWPAWSRCLAETISRSPHQN